MEKEEFLKIQSRIKEGTASEKELLFFEAYDRLFELQSDGLSDLSTDELEALEKTIRSNIGRKMEIRKPLIYQLTKASFWWMAATIFIAISAGLLIYESNNRPLINYVGKPQQILPGTKGAVLTLSNGQRIELQKASNGIIATQGKTQIAKSNTGLIDYSQATTLQANDPILFNTISTPRGSIVAILLPDGSKAYLNSGSSLRFPTAFSKENRHIELSGEAEFEVRHQPSRPFIVQSSKQKVEVLGTHFNVYVYPAAKRFKTTLIEGKVAVSTSSATKILQPGDQSIIASGKTEKTISVQQLSDPMDAVAWRHGIFHFEDASIKEVMETFSRWYDVDVTVDPDVSERSFSGDLYKTLSLEKALELLHYHKVYFEIKGRHIRVRS